jgi:hypothetical protein
MDVHHPILTIGQHEFEAWTLLGRLPVAIVFLALAWWVGRRAGWRRGALALSGACAGLALGVALLPSVLGAVAGMLLLGGLTLRVTRAPAPSSETLAAALLGVIGVGRFGCLLGGCCFGVPTQLPWGVTSGAGSTPARFHALLGLVGPGQASLHVHPVQAYEGLAALALLAALPWLSRSLRSGLAGSLAAAGGYLLVRVAVDPLRAMVNTTWSVMAAGPLTAFQWAALGAAAVCLVAAVLVARRPRPVPEPRRGFETIAPEPGPARMALALAGQAAASWLGLPSLGPYLAALVITSLVASGLLLVQLVLAGEAGRTPHRKLAATMLVALLVPIGLRATEPSTARSSIAWVYAPLLLEEPGSDGGDALGRGSDPSAPASPDHPARLVRVGDQSTSEGALQDRAAKLGQAPTRRFFGHVGGSSMDYEVAQSGCGSPTQIRMAQRSYAEGGLAYESASPTAAEDGSEGSSTWQLRGSVRQSSWSEQITGPTPTVPKVSGSGLRYTLGGMWQFDAAPVSLGLGALVGHDGARDPSGPAFTKSNGLILYPGAYLRLGGRSFGVEGGTMALYQPSEAPFGGIYIGPASTLRLRIGARWPYGGSEIPPSIAFSLQFPVDSALVQLGASAGDGIEATLRIGFRLP